MIGLGALSAPQWRVVVIVAAIAAVIGLLVMGMARMYGMGYDAGELHEREQTREAMDARQREDQRLAGQLAATARAEAQSWRDNAYRLQQEIRRAQSPLVVAPACAHPAGGGADVVDGVAAAAAEPGAAASGASLSAGLPVQPAALRLSAAAVGLWDSALAGAAVPPGACGAADAPSEPCAAATDITVDDAWANHNENAARCGVDRANHQRLIEFLRRRQPGALDHH